MPTLDIFNAGVRDLCIVWIPESFSKSEKRSDDNDIVMRSPFDWDLG